MTSIGGPCQCEVCGEWCSGGAIEHSRGCYAARECGGGSGPCDCGDDDIQDAIAASTPSVVEGRAWAETDALENDIARAEGAALGYRMRALLAEAERDELAKRADLAEMDVTLACNCCDQYSAQNAQLTATIEALTAHVDLAYTIGRRDGLACARQQAALVGDVLRAAEAWSDTGGDCPGLVVALHDAVDVWQAAGRPGLPEGE